jgi:DNA-3-methyladenine glycosylase II
MDIEGTLSKSDPKLGRVITGVIDKIGRQRIASSRSSPFEALVRAIVYQGVSDKAAAAVYGRLRKAVAGELRPNGILTLPPDAAATIGLSKSKMTYLRNLAEWFSAHRQMAADLPALPDDEVVKTLTAVPGVGVWTANVFLIFNLGRLDVLPADDLGIRRGVQLSYGLTRVATPAEVREQALRWRPYRSIASIYLWNAVKLRLSSDDLGKARTAASNKNQTKRD